MLFFLMRFWIYFLLLCASTAESQEEHSNPNDQLLVIFGSSGYILYKVLDFAHDHGFRYIKILRYEFSAFDHRIQGTSNSAPPPDGRYFELRDQNSIISFLCFEKQPEDIYVIDLEKYKYLLEHIQEIN